MDIVEKVVFVTIEYIMMSGVSASDICHDAYLRDDFAMDETDVIDVLCMIEAKLVLTFPDDVLDHTRTVADLVCLTKGIVGPIN